MSRWAQLTMSSAPSAAVFVRIALGFVFITEGIQKFVYPDALGAGRFAAIGIPAPGVMGPFVGGVEIVCGTLVLVGLLTRLAAVPLVIDMLVALLSTKLPILLGHGFWGFAHPAKAHGFWAMTHEARTDVSMLCGALFLLLAGAGPWSVDARLRPR